MMVIVSRKVINVLGIFCAHKIKVDLIYHGTRYNRKSLHVFPHSEEA